jgi:hypothetical protein
MSGVLPGHGLTRRGLLTIGAIFGAAFGIVEGAVVVYLRALIYPEGFAFPLRDVPTPLIAMELVREAATIVLLLAAAWLAERRPMRRFAVFAYCFAVWDLVYYVTLKAALGWPPSLLDWDVLFLIPVPWLGPVLAPVLVSLGLIAAAVLILLEKDDAQVFAMRGVDWLVEIVAGLVIIGTFLANTGALLRGEAPARFPWAVFLAAFVLGAVWFARRWVLHRRGAGGAA